MIRMRTGFIVLVLVVLVLFAVKRTLHADSSKMPAVGQMAPDFTLPSQEDTSIKLSQYRGKWVVLYFYPKDMTSGCTMEAHNFQSDMAKYTAANAVILGVSVQDANSHKQFCAKEGLNFKLLADTNKTVSKQYDSMIPVVGLSARNTFLINPDGKIVKVWTGVNPQNHSAEVLAELAKDEGK
jgi:thioredoxin-dependent peroxiredoxin